MGSENICINRQNYNAIDLAKFVCSILVVSIHIPPFGTSDELIIIRYLNYGIQCYLARLAVPFFFVSSGFFLYKRLTLKAFCIETVKKYILRMLRLYMIWSLIYFPLSFIAFFHNEKGICCAILEYIRNCVFLGSYKHLWYLNASVVAVAIISFFLCRKKSPKKIFLISFVFYMIGLFAQSWFGFIKPLSILAPTVWGILKILQSIMVTTRNGLFEGFFFMSMGMFFAYYRIALSRRMVVIGFVISMVFLLLEVILLEYFDFIREHDMYFFLAPVTFFFFALACQVEVGDSDIYRTMRRLSSLIFFIHLEINEIVVELLKIIYEPWSKNGMRFLLVFMCSLLASMVILGLSEKKRFGWLKKVYGT